MKKPIFTGVCTALVTPFTEGKINYPMLEILLHRQMDAGIEAVVLAGTTGESPTLSDEEKNQMFHFAKDVVKDQMKIIAGTGSNATAHAVALSQAAEKAGADALLVVTPYYNKATPQGLTAHYLSIASAVSIPVILYNVPSRTGVDLPVSACKALSRIPNIAGIKEASADMTKITKLRNACGDDFAIWSGNDDLTTPVISLGGKGVISVLSNVMPRETHDLCAAWLNGDPEKARKLQLEYLDIANALFMDVNPIPVKEALNQMGFAVGDCRLPLYAMDETMKEKLGHILRRYELI